MILLSFFVSDIVGISFILNKYGSEITKEALRGDLFFPLES